MTPLTHEQIANLRALAEKATPGPWYVRGGYGVGTSDHGRSGHCIFSDPHLAIASTSYSDSMGGYPKSTEGIVNGEFIAACDPQTIIALCDAALPGWLPIESAPKDGRHVLLFYRNMLGRARTVVGFYAQENTLENENACYGDEEEYAPEGWYEGTWASETTSAVEESPTHWQPLPPPPQSAPASATHEWDAVGTRNPPYQEEPPEA